MRTEHETAKLRKITDSDSTSAKLLKSLNELLLTGASPEEVNEKLHALKRKEQNCSSGNRATSKRVNRKLTFREPPRPRKEILLKPHYYRTGSVDVIRYAEENFATDELKGFVD